MLTKILIANRGAIAVRIIRTLRKLGIVSVAVYAEADAESRHVALADEAYSLGVGGALQTYLDQDKLFAILSECGADGVHPGYGFLSENATFVERCEASGIAFIGPTVASMEAFGLKHSARALAQQNQVPLLPGSGLLSTAQAACAQADDIGYPVMLKSTAGGGGIGMQVCANAGELAAAFESVKRLGANNFANDGVFLEKYIARARHIEVQVFGDGQGNAIALGERDCSAQRRHQKVIEETPAPHLDEAVRAALQATAVRLMSAVQYRNAGTVEFIVDQETQAFYFLEVNTRLQVEHGVTELRYDVDLVEWMVKLAGGALPTLETLADHLSPNGHAIQVRVYAEDPHKDFQPCAGLLTHVSWPVLPVEQGRIDTWVEAGIEVPALFDPMLAKVLVKADNRADALAQMTHCLTQTCIEGIETNVDYVRAVLASEPCQSGTLYTRFLNGFTWQPTTLDVLSGGTLTTLQDYPGRVGYWHVGVPPSGPFDNLSFRLGNRLLQNPEDCAGLEMTLNGATLRFNYPTAIVLAGAKASVTLDGQPLPWWQVVPVGAGQVLSVGKVIDAGARCYLCVAGGIACQPYLGSRSTFTLGQFGGHGGRALRAGDVLHLADPAHKVADAALPDLLRPALCHEWQVHVIEGPHGAPDFFTPEDMESFYATHWEVHYNSSRTGIRLVGPKPQWARTDGGEAGMHPSNIHDNAYAFGTIDFTGDMPVILGPDGPSLGGFVCPATVIQADLWKLGQLKAGDKIQFVPVDAATAVALEQAQLNQVRQLQAPASVPVSPVRTSPILARLLPPATPVEVTYRAAGDHFLLVEYGPMMLDVRLRFRVHALMLWLEENSLPGIRELTPGIRSLQVHYDSQCVGTAALLAHLQDGERTLGDGHHAEVPSRIVYLPLSWDDDACRQAIDKYQQSVRKDAPWCPSNIEFIRRINGLADVDAVKRIVFDAHYLVMGLGDVYLGAPVATPVDPRHRLVTTKYNPARTWTAENSVGIGGSYLCVYGMEGPGGYQFVGRTLQMWNRYRQTEAFTQPWLLRFFDQIRFYPVSAEELQTIRRDFPQGRYPLRTETTHFSLAEFEAFLATHQQDISEFTAHREAAFAEELARWRASGQFHFQSAQVLEDDTNAQQDWPDEALIIDSHVAGSVWQWLVEPGDTVSVGQPVCVLESMKMEITVSAPQAGRVHAQCRAVGSQVHAGQHLLVMLPGG